MLTHATRTRAFDLLTETGLLPYLWEHATWRDDQIAAAKSLLRRLPQRASFSLALAVLITDREPAVIQRICRALTCSNEQRERITWLVEHHRDLDDPLAPSLADLKRLLAHPAFEDLRAWAQARYQELPDGDRRQNELDGRLEKIAADAIRPPPLVTGDDLIARGVKPGPVYKRLLDELYTRQLDEVLTTRAAALRALEKLLTETRSQQEPPE